MPGGVRLKNMLLLPSGYFRDWYRLLFFTPVTSGAAAVEVGGFGAVDGVGVGVATVGGLLFVHVS